MMQSRRKERREQLSPECGGGGGGSSSCVLTLKSLNVALCRHDGFLKRGKVDWNYGILVDVIVVDVCYTVADLQ